jgi:hypothetical protein
MLNGDLRALSAVRSAAQIDISETLSSQSRLYFLTAMVEAK